MFGLGIWDFIINLLGISSDKKADNKPSTDKKQKQVYYSVKSGETLYSIAKAHGVSVESLKEANGLKSNNISVGQRLKIPSKSAATIFSEKKRADNSGFQYYREISDAEITKENERNKFIKIIKNPDYTIKEGDTAGSIAAKFGVSADAVLALNSLEEKNLQIGQKIKIPQRRVAENVRNINDVAKATGVSLEYLKSLEQLEEKHNEVYTDKNGVKTIGIGHALDEKELKKYYGKTLSNTQIYTLLAQDLIDRDENIKFLVGEAAYKKMPDQVKDAVSDFVFNRGETMFENRQGLIDALKKGDYKSAISKMDTDYSVMKFPSHEKLIAYMNKFKDKRIFVIEKDGKTLRKYLSGLDKRRLFEISHASKIYKGNIPAEILSSAQKIYNRGLYFMGIEAHNGTIPKSAYNNVKSEYNSYVSDWFDGKIKLKQ